MAVGGGLAALFRLLQCFDVSTHTREILPSVSKGINSFVMNSTISMNAYIILMK